MRAEHSKTIKDADGNPHHYQLIQHGGRDGFRLLPRLLRVIAGPISGLKGLDASSLNGGQGVDLSAAGGALGALAEALIADDASDLVDRLLEHTTRDGQKVSVVFDQAYQGNYGELVQAVIFAAMANFGEALKRVPFAQGLGQKTTESQA